MKKISKFLGILLIMALVMSMGVMAFAEGETTPTYTITIDNTANQNVSIVGKTFKAYKIFDMTYSGTTTTGVDKAPHAYTIKTDNYFYTNTSTKALLDTYFTFTASASDSTVMIVGLKDTAGLAPGAEGYDETKPAFTETTARTLADALENYLPTADNGSVTASAETATINTNPNAAGYYVVYGTVKANDPADESKELVAALALTSTDPTGNVKPKVDAPPLDKKITGEHLLDAAGKAATAQVGTTVSFQLDSKVPDLTGYSKYTFIISDTMTSGLTFTDPDGDATNDIVVKINNVDKTSDVTVNVTGQTFTVTIPYAVLKAATKGQDITVTYSAVVNENALNTNYEKNTATLEYSNNPYEDTTNKTPDKEVFVIDVNIDVDKYTSSGLALDQYKPDNAFASDGNALEAGYVWNSEKYGTDFGVHAPDAWVLKDGTTAKTPLAGAEFKLFKGATQPADTAEAWYKWDDTNKKVTWVTKANSDTFTSTAEGKFNPQVRGLEAEKTGTDYGLLETKAPDGYNLLKDPVLFKLTGAYDGTTNKATITASTGTVTNGSINLSETAAAQPVVTEPVLNQTGAELPSTGGIGTTIFYVVGSILVVAAGVLLITKKRMSREG